jgi:integrase/recombinase XerC
MPVDVLAAHLQWLGLRGRAAGTIYQRRRVLHRFAAVIGVPILDATADDLLTWRVSLSLAGPSVRCSVSHVRNFYTWLAEQGYRPDNPAARLPVPRRERYLPRPVGEDDLMRALETAPERIRPWLALAGWCGLRAREIALLRRDAVLDQALPPMLLVQAESAKGNRERLVPLPPLVLAELRKAGMPASGWMFRRHDGQPGPNAPWTVSHLAARHLRASGADATLHQLRHRYASQAYKASGRDLRLVQELLGHQDPATTAGYTQYDQSAAVAAVAALPVPRALRAVSE